MRFESAIAIQSFLLTASLTACGDDAGNVGGGTESAGTTEGSTTVGTTASSDSEGTTVVPSTTSGASESTSVTSGDTTGTDGATSTGTSAGSDGTESATGTAGTTDTGTTGTTGSTGATTTSGSTGSTGSTSTTGNEDAAPGFVGLSTDDALVVFDTVSQDVLAGPIDLLPEADYPYDATLRPGGAEAWIVGASGDGVVVIDAATYAILNQSELSVSYLVDVSFAADGETAFIASRDGASLALVDTGTYAELMTTPTPNGNDAGKTALNPCTNQLYVVEWYGSSLMTYDIDDDSWESVDLGGGSLWDLVVHPSGETIYVTDRGSDVVHVFDVSATGGLPTSVPDASIAVGDDPWGIDITADGSTVIVACEDDSTVHFIDTTDLSSSSLTLPADADPRDVDIAADDLTAYLPSGTIAGDDAVYAIDLSTQTLAATITLGDVDNPNVIAVTPPLVTCSR